MCDQGKNHEGKRQQDKDKGVRKRCSFRQCTHKLRHEEIQDAHSAHDHKVHDNREESSLFCILYTLIGKRIFTLNGLDVRRKVILQRKEENVPWKIV